MKKIYFLFLLQSLILNLPSSFGQAGTWTWISGDSTINSPGVYGTQGVPNPSNVPPALYEPCEWTDLNGNFWMYGGLDENIGISVHNDLWEYDPVANMWTWMTGTKAANDTGNFGIQGVDSASNRPPSLAWGTSSWVDLKGNLWMFGGCINNSSSYVQSNLWKYDIAANEWTWVNGPGLIINMGIYGTQGVPDAANYPPGRCGCAAA